MVIAVALLIAAVLGPAPALSQQVSASLPRSVPLDTPIETPLAGRAAWGERAGRAVVSPTSGVGGSEKFIFYVLFFQDVEKCGPKGRRPSG